MVNAGFAPSLWPPIGGQYSNQTLLLKRNPVTGNGTLTSWTAMSRASGSFDGTIKLKVFRLSGSNYLLIGESDGGTFSAGVQKSVSCSIAVQTGDNIGIYISTTMSISWWDSGGYTQFEVHSGEVTTDTPTSEWSGGSDNGLQVYATDGGLLDVYVDINKTDDTLDGSSFGNAKKTMNAGWNAMSEYGVMHVASGDYSMQTGITYNKCWKLSPEDPNATGSKNVKIPPSV